MEKTLGLDIGKNSVGWAIVNKEAQKIIDCGVKIFPNPTTIILENERQNKRRNRRLFSRTFHLYKDIKPFDKIVIIKSVLICCTISTALLGILNRDNWQLWLNLSLTIFVTLLTVLSQDKK